MPIIVAIAVNFTLILGVVYFLGFDFYVKLIDNIDLITFFLGMMYLGAAQIMGGMIRAACGLGLVILSAIDFGIPESADSVACVIVALVGALT